MSLVCFDSRGDEGGLIASDRVPFGTVTFVQRQVSFQPRPPLVTLTCALKLDTPEITQEILKFRCYLVWRQQT